MKEQNKTANTLLEEIYELEAENPPLVSKSKVIKTKTAKANKTMTEDNK